jgi:hypothetical protein
MNLNYHKHQRGGGLSRPPYCYFSKRIPRANALELTTRKETIFR